MSLDKPPPNACPLPPCSKIHAWQLAAEAGHVEVLRALVEAVHTVDPNGAVTSTSMKRILALPNGSANLLQVPPPGSPTVYIPSLGLSDLGGSKGLSVEK